MSSKRESGGRLDFVRDESRRYQHGIACSTVGTNRSYAVRWNGGRVRAYKMTGNPVQYRDGAGRRFATQTLSRAIPGQSNLLAGWDRVWPAPVARVDRAKGFINDYGTQLFISTRLAASACLIPTILRRSRKTRARRDIMRVTQGCFVGSGRQQPTWRCGARLLS